MHEVFSSPGRLFSRLREKPVWLLPLALAAAANLAATAVSLNYVDWSAQRDVTTEQLQQRGMSEADIEQALERMEAFTGNPLMRFGVPLAGALVTQLVAFFFLALIYNLSLPLLGVPGGYVRVLAVTAHAGLVAIPAALLRILLIILRRSAEATTSLLAAVPTGGRGFLQVVLSRVDPFVFWGLVLTGLGLKIVFDVRGSKSYWLVGSLWLVLTLVFALLAGFTRG
ncbi:MAG: YIP1 family protein [bacterium]